MKKKNVKIQNSSQDGLLEDFEKAAHVQEKWFEQVNLLSIQLVNIITG